jgi:hypothetical protein
MKRREITDLIKKLEHPRFVGSERTNELIKNIINGLILIGSPSNVVSISLPKDVSQHSESAKKEITNICNSMLSSMDNQAIITGFKKIIFINEKARNYITNRAREVLSHEKHTAVYEQLNDRMDGTNGELYADNWAEAWIMIVELEDMLNEIPSDGSSGSY